MRRLSPTSSTPTMGEFEIASTSGSTIERDLEDRLAVRLVEAGEAAPGVHRLELRGRDGLRLTVRARVRRPVEAAQLVVEGAGEAAADGARPGGSSEGGRKTTCSSSSSKATLQPTVLPSAPAISTSLMASSAAFSTTSFDRLEDHHVDGDRAREGGGGNIRLDLHPVRPGSTVRGRRNASEAGATGWVGPLSIR